MNDLLETAIAMALNAHRGQVYQGATAYILHPLRVMMQMDTDEERIVAVLHDAVEHSRAISVKEIEVYFGPRIAAAVEALTKIEGENYDAYLARVMGDYLPLKVKLAELEDNLEMWRVGVEPSEADLHRRRKYIRAQDILLQALRGNK